MSIITVKEGRRGAAGADGDNGTGVSDIRESLIDNPLISVLHPNNTSKNDTLTFTRTTQGANTDRYGERGYQPPDTATNLILHSTDFSNAVWLDNNSTWSYIGTTTDPLGGSNAHEINLDVDTRSTASYDEIISQTMGVLTDESYSISVWMKLISGVVDTVDLTFVDSVSVRRENSRAELTTEWTRMDNFRSPSGSLSSSVGFNPRGDSGSRVALYAAQLQLGDNATENITTTTTSVTENYTNQLRENEKGYLIEGSIDNMVPHPNGAIPSSLLWSVTNGTLDAYTGADPFGIKNKYTKVVFSTVQTVTLTVGANVASSADYSLSFWLLDLSGLITDVSVSIAGSDPIPVETIPTDVLTRQIINFTGATGSIIFSFTSSEPSAAVAAVVSGVRLEPAPATSYYDGQRAADIVSIPWTGPAIDGLWSVAFNHSDVANSSSTKYVFNNGLSGANTFSANFLDNDLVVNLGSGSVTFTDARDSASIVLTFDGSLVRCYGNGVLIGTSSSFGLAVATIASTLYIGADSSQANAINAYLRDLQFWGFTLTANEAAHVSGVR